MQLLVSFLLPKLKYKIFISLPTVDPELKKALGGICQHPSTNSRDSFLGIPSKLSQLLLDHFSAKGSRSLTRGLGPLGSPNCVQTADVLGNGGSSGLWQEAHVIQKQEAWLVIPAL